MLPNAEVFTLLFTKKNTLLFVGTLFTWFEYVWLAQLVERLAVNQDVVGSIPSPYAIIITMIRDNRS